MSRFHRRQLRRRNGYDRMTRALAFETLESRRVLSGDALAASLDLRLPDGPSPEVNVYSVDDVLVVNGTAANDTITIREKAEAIAVDGNTQTWDAHSIRTVLVAGHAGDDVVSNHSSLPAFIVGGAGDDTLVGGSSDDTLLGSEGNDEVFGGGGDDVLHGDAPLANSTRLFRTPGQLLTLAEYQGSLLAAVRLSDSLHRVLEIRGQSELKEGSVLYEGQAAVNALAPYQGGVLAAFANVGGNPDRHMIRFSPDGTGLENGKVVYEGVSPVEAMVAYGGGVLTAFSNVGGNPHRHRVHWSPDGKGLGTGPIVYDGISPVTAMTVYEDSVLTAFSNVEGKPHLYRVHRSPDGTNVGGGEILYEGSSLVVGMTPHEGGVLSAFLRNTGTTVLHFSSNGQNLGGGEPRYAGHTPITSLSTTDLGTLVGFHWKADETVLLRGVWDEMPRGDDIVAGGSGNDTLWGGLGDDVLRGDEGTDTYWGDEGNDEVVNRDSEEATNNIEFRTKATTDVDGTEYRLRTPVSEEVGVLQRFDGERWEHLDDVRDFSIQDGELHITRSDGESEVIYVRGELASIVAQDAEDNGTTRYPITRGIVGRPGSERELVAPRALLDCVGRIERFNVFNEPDHRSMRGTGTVLSYGGNRYVLTAAHVVEDEYGRPLPASQFQFVVQSGDPGPFGRWNIDSGEVYRVREILHRQAFGGRDLALLALDQPVPNVQGAFLYGPFTPLVGQEVIVVGFGWNPQTKYGTRLFGFSSVDERYQTYPGHVGEHLLYEFGKEDTLAFSAGDSGGPDFVPLKVPVTSAWVPVLTGVHSFMLMAEDRHYPLPGEETWSVQITNQVVDVIRKVIPWRLATHMQLDMRVIDDSDPFLKGSGEWHATLTANGQAIPFVRAVDDGKTYTLWGPYEVHAVQSFHFSFGGYEEDSGFFDGNDSIPAFHGSFQVPALLKSGAIDKPFGSRRGDASYDMWIKLNRLWVPVPEQPRYGLTDGENDTVAMRWQNPRNPLDVDNNGAVSPMDALLVINRLNEGAVRLPQFVTEGAVVYVDPSGDGTLAPVDVLHVVNFLNRIAKRQIEATVAAEGEGASDESIYFANVTYRHSATSRTPVFQPLDEIPPRAT